MAKRDAREPVDFRCDVRHDHGSSSRRDTVAGRLFGSGESAIQRRKSRAGGQCGLRSGACRNGHDGLARTGTGGRLHAATAGGRRSQLGRQLLLARGMARLDSSVGSQRLWRYRKQRHRAGELLERRQPSPPGESGQRTLRSHLAAGESRKHSDRNHSGDVVSSAGFTGSSSRKCTRESRRAGCLHRRSGARGQLCRTSVGAGQHCLRVWAQPGHRNELRFQGAPRDHSWRSHAERRRTDDAPVLLQRRSGECPASR